MLEADFQEWEKCSANEVLRSELRSNSQKLVNTAYFGNDISALGELHKALALIYTREFSSAEIGTIHCEMQPIFRDIAAIFEKSMFDYELSQLTDGWLEEMPKDGQAYVKWLKKIISEHTSSVHPLYNDFLANRAESSHLAFYFAQETNLDPRFDDILAFLQIGVDVEPKLELAKNYFDEMGNGELAGVHSKMFKTALQQIGVDEKYLQENMLLDAQISGNISGALALSRRHYFKAIGYFGVTEYLAPRRFKHVVNAWRRNGLPEVGIAYHELHIGIDAVHANGWFNNVVAPAVSSNPEIGREIAIGAMIRLNSSEKYLNALLAHLEEQFNATQIA
ncbi:iron-containing redox enzyme family protein [Glaciimonas immobilis]|nr:iron-containing redox enzyme family protein [Glaciimonas immobilis]